MAFGGVRFFYRHKSLANSTLLGIRDLFLSSAPVSTGYRNVGRKVSVQYNPVEVSKRHISSTIISSYDFDEVYDIHDGDRDSSPIILPNNEAEYLIIGGGAMGLCLAFHLWRNIENTTGMKASKSTASMITVVERDISMKNAATSLAVGGIRQQFSNPCNIKLSMKSAEYLRNIKYHLGTAGHDLPDIQFNPQGYLFLASKDGAETLMQNYETQVKNGAKIMILTQSKLKEKFPWMNTEGIELASYGLENEGWFDPWSLMEALKVKLKSFGVRFINGEVVGLKKQVEDDSAGTPLSFSFMPDGSYTEIKETLTGAYIKLPDVDKPIFIKSRIVCNCAGPWSKDITEMLGVGVEESTCDSPVVKTGLPVEPRKRWVYTVHCPDGPIFDCPMVVDTTGAYIRRDGFNGHYICGMAPPNDDEVDHSNLDIDYDFFHEEVWPRLAFRIPALEKLKLTSAWSGYYEYNTFDCNGVIGKHPYYSNFCFLTGFSGHGVQMSMGAAACLAEMLVTGPDKILNEINIEPLSFNRFVLNRPLLEINIV